MPPFRAADVFPKNAREVYIHHPKTSKRAGAADRHAGARRNVPQNHSRQAHDSQNHPAGIRDASEDERWRVLVSHSTDPSDEIDKSGNKTQKQSDHHRPRICTEIIINDISNTTAYERRSHKVPAQCRELHVSHTPANLLIPRLGLILRLRSATRLWRRIGGHAHLSPRTRGAATKFTGANLPTRPEGVKTTRASRREKRIFPAFARFFCDLRGYGGEQKGLSCRFGGKAPPESSLKNLSSIYRKTP